MAYFRGDTYIWSDRDDLHLWAHDGMDGWENAGWCIDDEGNRWPGYEDASGISIHNEIIDQFLMMRLAQILVRSTPEQVEELIDKAAGVGNVGSDCLKHNIQALKAALLPLRLEEPERY